MIPTFRFMSLAMYKFFLLKSLSSFILGLAYLCVHHNTETVYSFELQ